MRTVSAGKVGCFSYSDLEAREGGDRMEGNGRKGLCGIERYAFCVMVRYPEVLLFQHSTIVLSLRVSAVIITNETNPKRNE